MHGAGSSLLNAPMTHARHPQSATARLLPPPHVLVMIQLWSSENGKALLTGFEEVYPLWALSLVSFGGLGWSTMEIGKVCARRCRTR